MTFSFGIQVFPVIRHLFDLCVESLWVSFKFIRSLRSDILPFTYLTTVGNGLENVLSPWAFQVTICILHSKQLIQLHLNASSEVKWCQSKFAHSWSYLAELFLALWEGVAAVVFQLHSSSDAVSSLDPEHRSLPARPQAGTLNISPEANAECCLVCCWLWGFASEQGCLFVAGLNVFLSY